MSNLMGVTCTIMSHQILTTKSDEKIYNMNAIKKFASKFDECKSS